MAILPEYTFHYIVALRPLDGDTTPNCLGGLGSPAEDGFPSPNEGQVMRFGDEPKIELRRDGIWLFGEKSRGLFRRRLRKRPPYGAGVVPTGPAALKLARPGDRLELHYDQGCRLSVTLIRDVHAFAAIGDLSMLHPSRLAGISVQLPDRVDKEGYVTVSIDDTDPHHLTEGQSVRLIGGYEVRLYACSRLLIPSRYVHMSFAACQSGVDPSHVLQAAKVMDARGRYNESRERP